MNVRIDVVDVSGRVVRRVVEGTVVAGSHSVLFDGRDRMGRTLPSGIYFVRFESEGREEVRQVSFLK
jgi:flagellar hook assembly protein FlgD